MLESRTDVALYKNVNNLKSKQIATCDHRSNDEGNVQIASVNYKRSSRSMDKIIICSIIGSI